MKKEFIGTLFVSVPDTYLRKHHGVEVPDTIIPIFPYKEWDGKTHITVLPIFRMKVCQGVAMHVKMMHEESDAVVYGNEYQDEDLKSLTDGFRTLTGNDIPDRAAGQLYVFGLLSAKTVEEYSSMNITFHTKEGIIQSSDELYHLLNDGREADVWVERDKGTNHRHFIQFLSEKNMGNKYVIRPLTTSLFYKTMDKGTMDSFLLGNVFDALKFDSEDDALYFAEAHAHSFRASGFEVLRIQNYPYK